MLVLAAAALFVAVAVGPQLYVHFALTRHAANRTDIAGTGAELARHLAQHYELGELVVEPTARGDHYDPEEKAVRLSPKYHDGRSVAALAVAAHELSHAIQDATGDPMLAFRQRLAKFAVVTDRIAGVVFLIAPFAGLFARTPVALLAFIVLGIALLAFRVVVHLVTLPVEFDASFRKALPILEKGGYLDVSDMPAARTVLLACALTYVSAALISMVNLARWVRLLR